MNLSQFFIFLPCLYSSQGCRISNELDWVPEWWIFTLVVVLFGGKTYHQKYWKFYKRVSLLCFLILSLAVYINAWAWEPLPLSYFFGVDLFYACGKWKIQLEDLGPKKDSPAAQLNNDIDAHPQVINWLDLGPKSNQISDMPPFCLIFPIFFSDKKSRKVMKFKAGRRSVGELAQGSVRLDGQ